MSIKIVVDTNILAGRNTFGKLFGNRRELENILAIGDIELLIPSIVIDELIHQKRSSFQAAKGRLLDNSIYKLLDNGLREQGKAIALDIDDLILDVSIPYTLIDITNEKSALSKIRKLAINYEAPFQVYSNEKDNSDKGFKDAYLAMTVDDYLDSHDNNEKILLLTNDSRLAEYFENNDRVVWVKNYNEITHQVSSIETRSISITGNAMITKRVTSASKHRKEIQTLLTEFRNSASFTNTHELITNLESVREKLNEDDCVDILVSATQNSQISWILADPDVNSFIMPLFEKFKDRLTPHQFNVIVQTTGVGYSLKAETPPVSSIDDLDW